MKRTSSGEYRLMQSEEYAVVTEHLTRTFDGVYAVRDLNLTIPSGELFVFLGPNGAGKSTALRLLACLLYPTSGRATVWGLEVPKDAIQIKTIMGYLPEWPELYDKLTAREFLNFVADLRKMGTSERRSRIDYFLQLFEMDDKADDLIESYSRGMRQKIAISAVLLHDPKMAFLDEPTNGLDPKGARIVKNLLRDLCDRGGAVFMTTHILDVAEKMCDRVGIIKDGVTKVNSFPSSHSLSANFNLRSLFQASDS